MVLFHLFYKPTLISETKNINNLTHSLKPPYKSNYIQLFCLTLDHPFHDNKQIIENICEFKYQSEIYIPLENHSTLFKSSLLLHLLHALLSMLLILKM